MKNSMRSGALLALALFCIFIQDACSTILWDGNVEATASAWMNPVETIRVDSGASLTVSAPEKAVDPADLDSDNDVDGRDLFLYLQDLSVLPLIDFTQMFGWITIPDNATLDTLSVSPGTLCPGFSPDQADYLVELENDAGQVWITAVPSDPLAEVWINGEKADPGLAFAVSPAPGASFIPVRVASRDGSTEKTYSLMIKKQGTAALSGLAVLGCGLTPAFSPDTFVYTLSADSNDLQVLISAETRDLSDELFVNGSPAGSGTPVPVLLDPGTTEVEVTVSASDGSQASYFVYVRNHSPAGRTVFVVDHAAAGDEFETLSGAIEYLNTHLGPAETGEIRIQTTSPMEADGLNLARNIILTVEPGASNVIAGPSAYPMVINAFYGADISGFSFSGSPSYTVNSGAGLSVRGTLFSSDALIHLGGAAASVQTKDGGYSNQYFEFIGNHLSGRLNIMLSSAADGSVTTSGNQAEGIQFSGFGQFVGDAALNCKANLTEDLKIMATLTGSSRASVMAHRNVVDSDFHFTMQEFAQFNLEQHTTAMLGMELNGLKGQISLKNVTTVKASYTSDMKESNYTGTANSITDFDLRLLYSQGDSIYGFTHKGAQFFRQFSVNGENAPLNAQLTLGLDGVTVSGKYNLVAGGKVTATLENDTVITMDAYMKLPGKMATLDFTNMTCYGKLTMEFPESGVQLYLNAQYATLKEGMFMDFMEPAGISGTLDHVVTVTGGIMGRFGSVEEMDVLDKSMVPPEGETLVFKNLDIKDTQGRPALFLEKITVPVTIQNSRIESQTWAVVCDGLDADVTIKDNANLKGGIFLNGDPDGSGAMIDRAYVVSGNTITQSMAGGSCLASHAIRNVQAADNTMTASGGANGIMLSGGKMTVDGGTITAMGGAALMTGPSAGGTTGFLDVRNLDGVSGFVIPAEQGYVKLSNTTFSNATVFDVEQGRLINDPMAEGNSGLNPDQDIVGCLIDWNDDEHHCPDYPPRCDEWDEDNKKCGCGEDGIDPPSEPWI